MKTLYIYFDETHDFDGIILNNKVSIPGCFKIMYKIPLVVSGKSYKDRKNDLREKAIEYQHSFYDFCNWSYYELSIIQDFFEKNGKRYGLLKEFIDNGIV